MIYTFRPYFVPIRNLYVLYIRYVHIVYVIKFNKPNVDNLLPQDREAGGDIQKWKNHYQISRNQELPPFMMDGINMVVIPEYVLNQIHEQNPFRVKPENYSDFIIHLFLSLEVIVRILFST